MSLEKFKENLVCVFDDNLHTKVWHNIVDWTIIGLIILSSLEVFLSTFSGIAEQYGSILHVIDILTTIVFTIEVTLRIWVADRLDPKYKGFWGRVKYCFSFYGLIDFLSTYPFYLSFFFAIPVSALKILRVARLLRIFRYMKSFRILGEAISSKKQELSISIVFLGILTIILSFLLYFAEHDAQPELCENGWQTMVWAFAKYLGDPGKIADFPLVTFWGHFIAAIVGILGIAIFAVPAGLIGSGFVEVIEEKNHESKIATDIERIKRSFIWANSKVDDLYVVPPFLPIDYFLVRRYIDNNEVVDAVKESPELHLYNLAKAFNTEENANDRVVVVCCPNNRPYGACIDRGSNVTIVSTSGYDEPITGWVAFHLAKIGGFNYIGVEQEYDPDHSVSYFNLKNPDANEFVRMYFDDLNRLSSRPDSWVIPMCFCVGPKSREHSIHLCCSSVRNDNECSSPDVTFEKKEEFMNFADDLAKTMEDSFGMKTDRNGYYVVHPQNNILHRMTCNNGFALRLECRDIYFPADKVSKIKTMADVLNRHFDRGVEKQIPKEMILTPSNAYAYDGFDEIKNKIL